MPEGPRGTPTLIRFDCFEVDLDGGLLLKRGARVRLRDQSFQVLAALLRQPGQIVSREELRHLLWPDHVFVDFENNLNTAVGRLREALGDSAEHARFIETVTKRGYRFIAPVSAPDRQASPVPPLGTRVLVLPFVNASDDRGQEYVADAMTDGLITELARVLPATARVIARATAMHYKGTHKDAGRIGHESMADYLIEGSVDVEGDRDRRHGAADAGDRPVRRVGHSMHCRAARLRAGASRPRTHNRGPPAVPGRACACRLELSSRQRQMFRQAVIRRALVKSMKNAPTIGTTRKALGAGPYRSASASMLAMALAVVPSMNPQKPLDMTAAS